MMKKMKTNLIDAVITYGMHNFWSDEDIIDVLTDCGMTKQDYIDCGFGAFAEEHEDYID